MTAGKAKKLIAVVAVALCLCAATPAAELQSEHDLLKRTALERLLGNHKVINILDDFLVFWEQAHDKPLRSQRRIWRRTIGSKYRDYFQRAVYRGADNAQRLAMLNEFLIRVPERVEAIRELNRTIIDSLLVGIITFRDFRFREYQHQRDVYVGLSMFRFDGAVRPVQNETGIPDTLCLGAEVLATYTPEQVRMTITHEFFHLYHFGFLFQQPGVSSEDFRAPHIPLLVEGMAVAGAEQVYDGQPRTMYLHFDEAELAAQQKELSSSAGRFLDLIRTSAPPDAYERWFTQSYDERFPSRAGYLLGYEVAKRMMLSYTLEQMVRMSPEELRAHAQEELAVMSGNRVMLMASSR